VRVGAAGWSVTTTSEPGRERLTVGGQPDFQHKSSDPTLYDAFGNTRERGRRYGVQFSYNFGE
jgi:hypothetical protein